MHAASVNPEPGSNSLKNVICSALRQHKSFFRGRFLASLTLEFLSGFLTRFLLTLFVLSEFCCSIFKDRTAALPALRLFYYTSSCYGCQEKIQIFSRTFCCFPHILQENSRKSPVFAPSPGSPRQGGLASIACPCRFVKSFFKFFPFYQRF